MADWLPFSLGLQSGPAPIPKWQWIVTYHSVCGSIENFLC